MRTISICFLSLVVGAGCAKRHLYREAISGIDEPCTADSGCRPPLVCDQTSSTCQPSHALAAGATCGITDDCAPSLYCARVVPTPEPAKSVCVTAGSGTDGATCGTTADCEQGLYCAFEGLGGTCRPGGTGDIGDRCSTRADCRANLMCDWVTGECLAVPPPLGRECSDDPDCDPAVGLFCVADSDTKVCAGLGPDGMPVTPWTGATCPDLASVTGDFNVIFEVGTTSEDFFRIPFPNDIRRDSDGMVSLTGFPRPPLYAVPSDLVGRYIEAIEARQNGFGPNQSVFLRTSHRPLFCASGCGSDSSCADGCMGHDEPEQSIYVVDLTDGRFTPISYQWRASSGSTAYLCGPWIAVLPAATTPWEPGHTYAVFLHMRVKGVVGFGDAAVEVDQAQDSDFAAMLTGSSPGGSLATAWSAYQPLRDWLAGAPTYPVASTPVGTTTEGNGCTETAECEAGLYCAAGNTCEASGSGSWGAACSTNADCIRGLVCHPTNGSCGGSVVVTSADIGGAAVFTVRDPTETLVALGDVIEAGASPAVSNLTDCSVPSPPVSCADTTGAPFKEVQGEIELPIFQEGQAPYLTGGGNIDLDGAVPQQHGTETAAFSLSIPAGSQPAGGWPVVVYAHGTGGSFQSHITSGVAQLYATATVPTAVIGIDQTMHGDRRGGSDLSADILFFNFANPLAARGNALQMAADQMSLREAIGSVSTQLQSLTGDSLDEARVGFVGHSQGSIGGTLAMARSSRFKTLVLSGAGGGLVDSLMLKTSPYDLPSIMRIVLADPSLQEGRTHPALNLIQGYLEDADPVNYGRHVTVEPLAGSVAKNVLQVIGFGDTFTPNETATTLAERLVDRGDIYVDDDDTGLDPRDPTGSPNADTFAAGDLPIAGNLVGPGSEPITGAATVHAPPAGKDGHFVLFDTAKAGQRAAEFFATWAADTGQPPSVVQ